MKRVGKRSIQPLNVPKGVCRRDTDTEPEFNF